VIASKKERKKSLLLIFTLLVTAFSFSQNTRFENADRDYKKSIEFEAVNIDSAFFYVEKAYSVLTQKDTTNTLYTDIINQYGHVYFKQKEYTKAYNSFQRCYDLSLNNGREEKAYRVKVNMAACQKQLNNTENALRDFLDVASYYEKTNPSALTLGITYYNIAGLYFINEQHEFASKYFLKSKPFFKDRKNLLLQLQGDLISNYNAYDTNKSLALIKEIKSTTVLDSLPISLGAMLYNNMAQTYMRIEQYDTSLTHTKKALEIKKKGHMKEGIAIQYNNVGDVYIKTNQPKLAIKYLDTALQNAVTNRQKFQILKNLQKAHKNNNDLEKSLEYANTYIQLKDSLNVVLTQKEIVELGLKYESKQKDEFIDKLKNLSVIYKILIALILISSIILLLNLFVKNKKITTEVKKLQKDLDDLKEDTLKEKGKLKNEIIHLKSKAILNSDDILYVKSDGHYVEYYTQAKTYPEIDRNTLSHVLETLPSSNFVRIHKSFLVNIYRIKIIKSTKIMLDNGVWINLSRTYKQQLKDKLKEG